MSELFLDLPNVKVPTEDELQSLEILRANILAVRQRMGLSPKETHD
jgi:hypothetical protein